MKNDLDYMTDAEIEETYRREVMRHEIEELRRRKKAKRIYNIALVIGIIIFAVMFFSPEFYNSMNTVGQPIP